MNTLKGTCLALAIGLAAVGMNTVNVRAADDLKAVTFSLDFIPLGRHAAWYAAKERGFFEEEGLDVTIIPSQGTAQVMQAIASGTAQFGFVDLPGVVLAQAGGIDIKMLTVNYQKSPYAIFSLANGGNVQDAAQLEGLALGSGAGSITPKVIGGFMRQNGLDPEKLNIANVAPPARASALLTGQVPAIEFFVMAKPGLEKAAKEAGTELRTYLLADNGLSLYSNGIGASAAYLGENPDVAKAFVKGALRGWQFAMQNPEKAAEDIMKNVDGLNKDIIIAELDVVRNLAVTADVNEHGYGWFSPEKMAEGVNFVIENVGVEGTAPEASAVYASGYLPATAVMP